MASSVHWI